MATAVIRLADDKSMHKFFGGNEHYQSVARQLIHEGLYRSVGTIDLNGMNGKEAADEIYDLSNNPSRQDERGEKYGNHRSFSVGDIVIVDGTEYLCMPFGWSEL